MNNLLKRYFSVIFVFVSLFFAGFSITEASGTASNVFLFGREGCHFCKAEKSFLETQGVNFNYVDVSNAENKKIFDQITKIYDLQKATPVTLVNGTVIQGFSSDAITGKEILNLLKKDNNQSFATVDDYLKNKAMISGSSSVCDNSEGYCTTELESKTEIEVPFFGVVNFKDFSLLSISVVFGFVDGFNPCAMWVLLAFLLILWQLGDKKKMMQVAGLFIIAEAVMYWLILNFWFKVFDFIGFDQIITPAVGVLALAGGTYFLYRYFKNRKELTCDVTSVEYKTKTEKKIKDLISAPLTIITALGIIGLAFSINMIEFACSIGIPQAFTKVLEINHLNVLTQQFYIFIYTLFYMADDIVVFALAVFGFNKFYSVGHKYSNLSSLIGGVLLLILGYFMLFNPGVLVF